MEIPTSTRRRMCAQVEKVGDPGPTVPETTRDTVPAWRFPLSARFFGASIFAARIPFVRAGDVGDEFTNNFATDLAPLLALFGDRVTTQFMSQSFGIADSIIFAVAPLGVVTAMAGAIRVGGPNELRAIIGRAREGRSDVELELMSSTSGDVCELWNGEGVVRALGKPLIIELIYVTPEDDHDDESAQATLVNGRETDVGIYDFNTATKLNDENSLLIPPSNRNSSNGCLAPNISLNMGGKTVSDLELWAVAIFGILLQLGVVVFAGSTVLLSSWNQRFQKGGKAVPIHAFPLMAGGTLTLVLGMFFCSHIVDRSTVEETWEIKKLRGATVKVAWLQRGGEVNDQQFGPCALFPSKQQTSGVDPTLGFFRHLEQLWNRNARRIQRIKFYSGYLPFFHNFVRFWYDTKTLLGIIRFSRFFRSLVELWNRDSRPSIRTSRKAQPEHQKHSLAVIATGISLFGFFAQFMGLRWLHWSVTVAQLVATVVMTVLRAWVRRNLIHKPQHRKIESGYELEWMARKIKDCQQWNVVTWGFDKSSPSDKVSAVSVVIARCRLGVLSNWSSQWSGAVDSTTEAIQATMNFLFSSEHITLNKDYWSIRDCFKWKMVIEVQVHLAEAHLEEITLHLKRARLLDGPWGPWRAVRSEVEAVLGLWMLHFKKPHDGERNDGCSDEDILRSKPILRVLGPYDRLGKMNYERWIARQSHYVKVDDLAEYTGGNERCGHVIGNPTGVNFRHEAPVLGVISDTVLERMCGQEMFSEFMSNVAEHIMVGGEVCVRGGNKGEIGTFGLSSTVLAGLAGAVERAKLANTEEAYMSIVPALSQFGKLPITSDAEIFANIVQEANSHTQDGRLDQADWFFLWLFHYAETSVDYCKGRGDWKGAGEIYVHLRRACEGISHPNEYTDEVDTRITLFCENIFTSIAIGPRNEDNPTDTLNLVGICMAKVLGEIPEKTLATWKEKNLKGSLPNPEEKEYQLLQAAGNGMALLVERLLRDKADIETHDSSLRTPLILACISGHATVVSQLIQKNAKTTTQDYYGRTPLHYASEKGYASVVQILLLCDGPINICDRKEQTPLDLAVERNSGAVINLLLFYGAEDIGGGARRLLHESSGNGSEAAIDRMPLGKEDLSLGDIEQHRAPVHWSVWRGSRRALKTLLDRKADVNAEDLHKQTPLHIAAMNGSLVTLGMLLGHGANMEAKDQVGQTALHMAANGGHKQIVQLLLDLGVDSGAKDDYERMALHRAAEGGHEQTVQLLLDQGANTEARDGDERTALHKAAEGGHKQTVQLLLDRGADTEAKAQLERTVLHRAVQGGNEQMVRLLLDRGANTEARDGDERTALHKAAEGGHEQIVQLLLDRGADMEARDGDERTALHRALEGGHEQTVQLLLDRGADMEARDGDERTALHSALEGGHEQIVQLLLDRGADMEARDGDERTALHRALEDGHEQMVQLLLDRGADMEARDGDERAALHKAAEGGHEQMVRLLLDRGADKKARDGDERTALHKAAEGGHRVTVRLLLDRGADKDARDQLKSTALHKAAEGGHEQTVRLLLDRGADKEARDQLRSMALHKAAEGGHVQTVRLLLNWGADKDARDQLRSTALHKAAEGGHEQTVRLLLDRGADKEAKDESQKTALDTAREMRHQPVVDILLAA